jgi:hypothetical protein
VGFRARRRGARDRGPTNVEIVFDSNIGLNVAGTRITFSSKEIDIPIGSDSTLKIVSPAVSLTINPLFRFVIFEIAADFPLTIFGDRLYAKLSMVVDNLEVEVGLALDIQDAGSPLTTPPGLRGVHSDTIGLGMGLVFEPPGYALGLQGAFHIGEGSNVVAVDDDQFAVILDLESEIPNPLYLSFYVPKLDVATVFTALTDITLDIDIPIEFADLSFTWSENPLEPLALPDGSMTKGGYGFSGYLHLFGLKFYADVHLGLDKVAADATMGPLDLAGILKLTGQGTAVEMKFDAQGNPIRNNTIPRTAAERAALAAARSKEIVPAGGPVLHIGTETSPHVKIEADATLFGVPFSSVDIVVDNSGLKFDLALPLAKVSCHLTTGGSLAASFSYGPDITVPLPAPLGNIHLQVTVAFSFSLNATSTDVTFTANGGFSFMNQNLTFGPLTLDVNITRLQDLVNACCHHIISEAGSGLSHDRCFRPC